MKGFKLFVKRDIKLSFGIRKFFVREELVENINKLFGWVFG